MQPYAPMLKLARTSGAGLLWLCAAAALAQPALLPSRGMRPPPALDRAQIERRMSAVGFLLEKSSAAHQIEASGDQGALERRRRAQQRYREAQAALMANDLAQAAQLLTQASRLIMEGARLAAPAQVAQERQSAQFEARLASVNALLAADLRIAAEKHASPDARQAGRTIEQMTAGATQLVAAGRLAEGRALLDQAYLAARAAVSSLRAGDTLTRSVHFASKQEEYQYELERNNTHRALVLSLVADQGGEQNAGGAVQAAAQLRSAAESRSAAGDYQGAIEQLEESTRQLLRAIRGLGIMVPGQE